MKTWVNEQLATYSTITATDAKIEALKKDLEGQLASQNTELTKLITSTQTQLQENITANKTLITELAERVTTIEGTDLSEKIKENTDAITKNSQTITNNAKSILDNTNNASNNNGSIESNTAKIKENEGLVKANTKLIEDNKALIEANKATIEAIEELDVVATLAKIEKNIKDIANNTELINANTKTLKDNFTVTLKNKAEIEALQTTVNGLTGTITTAYEKAITDAISTNNGTITTDIATALTTAKQYTNSEISKTNTSLNSLVVRVSRVEDSIKDIETSITDLTKRVTDSEENITEILNQIQSVSYVPTYADHIARFATRTLEEKDEEGKVISSKISIETATFTFEIKPASIAELIKVIPIESYSMKAIYTEAIPTKGDTDVTLEISNLNTSIAGQISLTVNGVNLSDEFANGNANASSILSITNGKTDISSNYIQLSVLESSAPVE
ncbi:MAG: hypothetical protein IMY73_04025 [Bacteroidetes bacterium]|nr:hypothetical protein [Bacteroidota bacterium]